MNGKNRIIFDKSIHDMKGYIFNGGLNPLKPTPFSIP